MIERSCCSVCHEPGFHAPAGGTALPSGGTPFPGAEVGVQPDHDNPSPILTNVRVLDTFYRASPARSDLVTFQPHRPARPPNPSATKARSPRTRSTPWLVRNS